MTGREMVRLLINLIHNLQYAFPDPGIVANERLCVLYL